jgi:hypothetical protein
VLGIDWRSDNLQLMMLSNVRAIVVRDQHGCTPPCPSEQPFSAAARGPAGRALLIGTTRCHPGLGLAANGGDEGYEGGEGDEGDEGENPEKASQTPYTGTHRPSPGPWPTLQDDQILFLIHSPLTIVCGVGGVCVCVCV